MIVQIPAREVPACDCCHDTGKYMNKCKACGRDFCLTCRAIIAGCVHQLDVCRKCGGADEILVVVNRYVIPLVDILKARDADIAAAGKNLAWRVGQGVETPNKE